MVVVVVVLLLLLLLEVIPGRSCGDGGVLLLLHMVQLLLLVFSLLLLQGLVLVVLTDVLVNCVTITVAGTAGGDASVPTTTTCEVIDIAADTSNVYSYMLSFCYCVCTII